MEGCCAQKHSKPSINKGNLNLLQVPVAWHHFTVADLEFFDANKNKFKVPLPIAKISKHHVDQKDLRTKGNKQLFFQTPNIPKSDAIDAVNTACTCQEQNSHLWEQQYVTACWLVFLMYS